MALQTAVWWYCWIFGICRRLWHKSKRLFAWWASSTSLKSAYVPTIVILSGFRRSLRGLLSWRSPLPQGLNTLGTSRRSLSYIRRPSSRWIALLGPSTFLRPPFHLVRRYFSSKRLTACSNYFRNLSPTHRRNLLVEKAEQKRVRYQG